MTRSGFLITASITLVFMYILVWKFDPEEYQEMARFAPADSLLYVRHENAMRLLKRIKRSDFFNTLQEIDADAVDPLLGDSRIVAHFQAVFKAVAGFTDDKIVNDIFGRKYGVILLHPENRAGETNLADLLTQHLVLIANPETNASFLEMLGKRLLKNQDDLRFSENQYGSHRIAEFSASEHTLYFSCIRSFFLFSLNESALRRCIDSFDGDSPHLLGTQEFKKIRPKYRSADIFAYLPLDNIRKFARDFASQQEFSGKDIFLKELATTQGFTGLGYGNWIHSTYIEDRVVAAFDSAKVNELVRTQLLVTPSESTMLSLGTRDPMFFYWSNTLNLKHFLLYLEDEANKKDDDPPFVEKVEDIIGKKAPQLLDLLGDEISVIVENGQEDLFFPVPEGIALVQVEDISKIQSIIESILTAYDIPMRKSSYGPATYYYWARSPQEGLQPLYGFWDDLFFVGNSSSTLQRVIHENVTGSSILDNQLFKKADPGFKEDNNSTTYSDNVKLLKVLKRGLEMFGTFIALENKETAIKTKYLLKELVFPILDGLTCFSSMASRSYFTPETVVVDSVINISPPTTDKEYEKSRQ